MGSADAGGRVERRVREREEAGAGARERDRTRGRHEHEHGREKRSAGTAGEGRTGKLRRSLRSEIGEQVLELSLENAVLQADECDVMQDGEPLQIDDTQRAGGQLARHSRLVQKRNSQSPL